jgi:hypothetical protein
MAVVTIEQASVFPKSSTQYFSNFTYFENICTNVQLFHEEYIIR